MCGPSEWTLQFGADRAEAVRTLLPVQDGVFVGGLTQKAGSGDRVLFRKYSRQGVEELARDSGELPDGDWRFAVPDASGQLYRVGTWQPAGLSGNRLRIEKLSASGGQIWRTEQDFDRVDFVVRLEPDSSGDLYVAASLLRDGVREVFVEKLNGAGDPVWSDTISFAAVELRDVAVDAAGHLLVAGNRGANDATQGFVRKYSPTGDVLWTHTFGSPVYDSVYRVSVGADQQVLIVGRTQGALPGHSLTGVVDGYVRVLSPDGSHQWTQQIGASGGYTDSYQASSAPGGEVYVVGASTGVPLSQASGDSDVWFQVYDASGRLLGSRTVGTRAVDLGTAIAIGPAGELYVGGATLGSFPGQSQGGLADALLMRASFP